MADEGDPQHTAERLLKMHTNRYEKRKAKELNLERIFRKQAQPQPTTSSQNTQHSLRSIAFSVIQPGPPFLPQQLPHTGTILSTSSGKLFFATAVCIFYYIFICPRLKFIFHFLVHIIVLQLLYYILYYNLKFWWFPFRGG